MILKEHCYNDKYENKITFSWQYSDAALQIHTVGTLEHVPETFYKHNVHETLSECQMCNIYLQTGSCR